jgi:HSP20 family protein
MAHPEETLVMERSFIAQWSQLQRKLSGTPAGPGWNPNTDVYECADGLVIRLEVAGVPADSVEVHLEAQALIVRGIRRGPCGDQTQAGVRYRQMEIEYGAFERVLPLPFGVDGEAARATVQGGLEIRLPRTPTTRPTRIPIQVP